MSDYLYTHPYPHGSGDAPLRLNESAGSPVHWPIPYGRGKLPDMPILLAALYRRFSAHFPPRHQKRHTEVTYSPTAIAVTLRRIGTISIQFSVRVRVHIIVHARNNM